MTAAEEQLLSVSVTPTMADHRHAVRRSTRKPRWALRFGGVALIAAALPALTAVEPAPLLSGIALLVVGFALLVASFLLVGAWLRRLPVSAFVTQTYQIGPDGVRLSAPLRASEWSWDVFRSAARTRDFWLLYGEPGEQPVVLLRRAFPPDAERLLEARLARSVPGRGAG